jgi:16S rRNA (guanine527-N7)-methyltransferase
MQNNAWLKFFTDTARSTGLTLSEKQSALFLRYMLELLEWNRSTNLTRIVEPRDIAIKHFIDSMLITSHIKISHKEIADIGSGGGFPGIPLAILDPSCKFVLIESLRKKTSFLKHIIRTLQLDNVQVYNGRAQSFPTPATFDLAISRAFASLADFIAIATRLIKPQGSIICMKGPLPLEEIEALKGHSKPGLTLDSHSYSLPQQGGARSLVVLQSCFT